MIRAALKKTVLTAIATLAISGGMGVVAQPANAAANCNSTVKIGPTPGGTYKFIPAVNGSTNCELGYGNQSAAVRALQQSLNRCYHAGLSADGIYGTQTQTAVRNAQRAEGIPDDGRYGPQTRSAMNHAYYYYGGMFQACGAYA